MSSRTDRDELTKSTSDGDAAVLVGPTHGELRTALRRDLARSTRTVPDLLLWVSYDHPETLLADWSDHVAETPWRVAFLTVGTTETAPASSLQALAPPDVAIAGWTDRSTGDLTGIGIDISKALPDADSEGGSVVVYVDSLTPLTVVNDRKRMYRFLHILLQRLRAAGAVCIFHLDPDAHDDATVATLMSAFDTVVEYDEDGWSIR